MESLVEVVEVHFAQHPVVPVYRLKITWDVQVTPGSLVHLSAETTTNSRQKTRAKQTYRKAAGC